ncbi:metallophosphoesterase family protein [Deinococcus sp.]|uniref:metallophosphoesterase family protein n=1 Tax=Deinococcus sp. TaxID=47478 RepID=UPI003CC6D14A
MHGGELLLAHGRPDSAWEALMYQGGPEQPTAPQELEARTADWPARRVVVVGHTHTELLRHWRSVSYVNAGAVSHQKDGDPCARWVLLERVKGRWNVQFWRVAYDVEAAAQWAVAHAPDGEWEARVLRRGER